MPIQRTLVHTGITLALTFAIDIANVSAAAIETAFSPEGHAEALVVRTIDNSHRAIAVAAYAFTSETVADALVRARQRGVLVDVLADANMTGYEDHTGRSRVLLSALAAAGARVRTITMRGSFHDKFLVIDDDTVETGSYNFSNAAARTNSENVIIVHQAPELADQYLAHWRRGWTRATPFPSP